MTSFTVVIAGRPNVGKSALANRLRGRRRSLVHDLPGVTRDVLEVEAHPSGRPGLLALRHGRLRPGGRRGHSEGRPGQGSRGDPRGGPGRARHRRLGRRAAGRPRGGPRGPGGGRRHDRRREQDRPQGGERRRGRGVGARVPEVYGVSAEHAIGVDDIQAAIGERMGPAPETRRSSAGRTEDRSADGSAEIALAVVGRPNVGKSSLVNALLGEERAIVSEIAGTTRDSVDAVLERDGRRFRLVDTAGIRRKARTERGPEVLSVVSARKRIEESDVALLVLDANEGVTGQDAAVASAVIEAGKGLVVIGNKWDLAGKPGEAAAKEFRLTVEERLLFASHAPLLLISAKTGRGISRVLDTVEQVAANLRRRISTGELNRVLGRALRDKPPRTAAGKTLKVFYVAQTGVAPPTFSVVANRAEPLHFSESRRVENIIREAADFSGSPIRISIRGRAQTPVEGRRKKSKVEGPRSKVREPKPGAKGPRRSGRKKS